MMTLVGVFNAKCPALVDGVDKKSPAILVQVPLGEDFTLKWMVVRLKHSSHELIHFRAVLRLAMAQAMAPT